MVSGLSKPYEGHLYWWVKGFMSIKIEVILLASNIHSQIYICKPNIKDIK